MVQRCVAAGCSSTHSDGVSLFKFPKDAALRRQWTKQVQRTRAHWSPSDRSVICSRHFESSCFESDYSLAAKEGLVKRIRLKCDSIPTIFEKPTTAQATSSATAATATARKRLGTGLSFNEPKKCRTAYAKRERSRVSTAIGIIGFTASCLRV